MTSDKLDNEQ